MRHPSRLQITDLEHIESLVKLELTLEEAEKIVGGVGLDGTDDGQYMRREQGDPPYIPETPPCLDPRDDCPSIDFNFYELTFTDQFF